MDWGFLNFLAEPWFVIPWYAVGILGMAWVIYDVRHKNTPLKTAMKWSWPIIVLFFSVLGLALYYGTARAPGIGEKTGDEAKHAHKEYEKSQFRRVNGAVVHCVAGDGLGIMTGMVIARILNMTFWQEFWFEYLVGFLFGWFIFQFRSMLNMTDSKPMALAMAFRAEFFSMLTVMAGMGAVMCYVTPLAVTEQPDPWTYAFWGFGALGLLVGYVFTFPMNWLMVAIGWKHGMGSMEDAPKAHSKPAQVALVTAMVVLGVAALALPAWLMEIRDGTPIQMQEPARKPPVEAGFAVAVLGDGLRSTLTAAVTDLENNRRSDAAHAIDSALRAAEVGKESAPGSAFAQVVTGIKDARHALHIGDEPEARTKLSDAADALRNASFVATAAPVSLNEVEGAKVINANGIEVGEIDAIEDGTIRIRLGGARDVWGFVDFGYDDTVQVPAEALLHGPTRTIGATLLAMPTDETSPMAIAKLIENSVAEIDQETP